MLSEEGRSLILAAALCTIVLNPLLFAALNRLSTWVARYPTVLDALERQKAPRMANTELFEAVKQGHAILVGYGRVGRTIGDALQRLGVPFVVVEQDRRVVDAMRTLGVASIYGDAARPGIIEYAQPATARLLVIATPDPYHARYIIDMARAKNPSIDIVVRTHSDQEQAMFEELGVSKALMGERELAFGMAYHSLRSLGVDDDRADDIIDGLRGGGRMQTREFSALMPTSSQM